MTNIPFTPLAKDELTQNSSIIIPVEKSKKVLSAKKQKDFFTSPKLSFLVSLLLLLTLFGVSFLIAYAALQKTKLPKTYDECINSDDSFMRESYPSVCVLKNGKEFVQPLSNQEQKLLESDLKEKK